MRTVTEYQHLSMCLDSGTQIAVCILLLGNLLSLCLYSLMKLHHTIPTSNKYEKDSF